LAGVSAFPFYGLETMYLLSYVVQPSIRAGWLTIVGASILACFTVMMWLRNVRLGAILQVILLLPGVIGMFATHRWRSFGGDLAGGIDAVFVAGLLVVAVIPGILLGVALLVLSSRRR
jgi:predicted membrane protein